MHKNMHRRKRNSKVSDKWGGVEEGEMGVGLKGRAYKYGGKIQKFFQT
jgi:hypothetical protein